MVEDQQPLVQALAGISRALVGVAVRSLPDGVTLPQMRALVVLSRQPTTRPSDLADALGVSPSSATRACDRLIARGLITRMGGDDDRREVLVSLTPPGRDLVLGALRRRARHLEHLAAAVSPKDREAFVRSCAALEGAVDSADRLAGDWLEDPRPGLMSV